VYYLTQNLIGVDELARTALKSKAVRRETRNWMKCCVKGDTLVLSVNLYLQV